MNNKKKEAFSTTIIAKYTELPFKVKAILSFCFTLFLGLYLLEKFYSGGVILGAFIYTITH